MNNQTNQSTKQSKTHLILIIICIILSVILLFSIYKVTSILIQYKADRDSYSALSGEYVKAGSGQSTVTDMTDPHLAHGFSPISIDFEALHEDVNKEIVGWIYCDDTVINYPVVQHDRNNFYLTHNAKLESTACGAIFMDCNNYSDFSDRNTVIHGHHINDGSMFGSFKKWMDQDYFDNHKVFYINTPNNGNFRLDMIAYFETPADSDAYLIELGDETAAKEWASWVKSQSVVKSDYTYHEGDRLVTLSTCMYSFPNARGVLIGHLSPLDGQGKVG